MSEVVKLIKREIIIISGGDTNVKISLLLKCMLLRPFGE
jgi:hypothetical protein